MIESTIKKHMSDREKLYKGYSNSKCENKFENYLLRNLKENFSEIIALIESSEDRSLLKRLR